MLIVDLASCAACGVEGDLHREVIAVFVDMCYALGQIERRVIVYDISFAVVAFKNLAYVLADFATDFKLLIVPTESAAVIPTTRRFSVSYRNTDFHIYTSSALMHLFSHFL